MLFPRESLVPKNIFDYRRGEYELGPVQLFKDLHDEKIMKVILSLNFALKCLPQANRRIRHHPLVITSDTTEQLLFISANAGMRLQAGSSLQGKSILNIREKVVL